MTDRDDRPLPQRTIAEATAALVALDFARWLAIHDVGLGNGVRSRKLQRAAKVASDGGDWLAVLNGSGDE